MLRDCLSLSIFSLHVLSRRTTFHLAILPTNPFCVPLPVTPLTIKPKFFIHYFLPPLVFLTYLQRKTNYWLFQQIHLHTNLHSGSSHSIQHSIIHPQEVSIPRGQDSEAIIRKSGNDKLGRNNHCATIVCSFWTSKIHQPIKKPKVATRHHPSFPCPCVHVIFLISKM